MFNLLKKLFKYNTKNLSCQIYDIAWVYYKHGVNVRRKVCVIDLKSVARFQICCAISHLPWFRFDIAANIAIVGTDNE